VKTIWLFIVSSVLLTSVSVCGQDYVYPNTDQLEQKSETAWYKRIFQKERYELPRNTVSILDSRLGKKIIVESVNATTTDTDTVEIMVRLVNRTDDRLHLESRSHFMNNERAPTEAVSGWKSLFLPPSSMVVYREYSVSTIPDVTTFLVEVRAVARQF
jgi:hypothetical protein